MGRIELDDLPELGVPDGNGVHGQGDKTDVGGVYEQVSGLEGAGDLRLLLPQERHVTSGVGPESDAVRGQDDLRAAVRPCGSPPRSDDAVGAYDHGRYRQEAKLFLIGAGADGQ